MNKYIESAICEIKNKTFEVTKQYLGVHEIEQINGQYVYDRIEEKNECIIIYFKVHKERFYIAFKMDKNTGEVLWIFPENGNLCYLSVTSDDLSLSEIASYTNIQYSSGYDKYQINPRTKKEYNHTSLSFWCSEKESFETEESILNLFNYLDKDKQGIKKIIKNSNSYISINKHQYISGNAGLHLNLEIINKLYDYGLEIDVDTYIVGNEIKG